MTSTASTSALSSSSSPSSSSTSSSSSSSSKDEKGERKQRPLLGIRFRSGPFKHLIPLGQDDDDVDLSAPTVAPTRINTREEPDYEEKGDHGDGEEEGVDEADRSPPSSLPPSQPSHSPAPPAPLLPSPSLPEESSAVSLSPHPTALSAEPTSASSSLLDLAQSSAAASPAPVKQEGLSLGQQVIALIARALRMQGELLAEYAAHVLLAEGVAQAPGAKGVDFFAHRFRRELQQSYDELKHIHALLQTAEEEGGEQGLDALFRPALGPLSTTLSSLLPSSVSAVPPFSPLASSHSSSTAQLAASLLAAKRGRGRLQKCEKHRRWKKRCPSDCPDKPLNKFAVEGDASDPSDASASDDDAPSPEPRPRKDRKRRHVDDSPKADPDDAKAKRVREAAAVQPAVPASPYQSLPVAAGASQPVEAVRAYEPTVATSMVPTALAMNSPTPQRSAVVVSRSHPVAVAHASHAAPSIPLSQSTPTLYTAQPLVLPSHPPPQLFAYSSSAPTFTAAGGGFQVPTTTLVTLEQLTAMQQQQQQQQGQHTQPQSFRLVQQQPQGAFPLRAAPAGQPVSVIYQAGRPQGAFAFATGTSPVQNFQMR